MFFIFFPPLFADIPDGENIDEAFVLDISEQGFHAMGTIIPGLIPATFPIEPTDGTGEALGGGGVQGPWHHCQQAPVGCRAG